MFPYYNLVQLVAMIDDPKPYQQIINDHMHEMGKAQGSRHNHQSWPGGYVDHVTETMNIAVWLYWTSPRPFPFTLSQALEIMFLHDIEKVFAEDLKAQGKYSKADRKAFRADFIKAYGIKLTDSMENALKYVEGVPDSDYKPTERTMGELAAFCHCCDILSARLWWHDGDTGRWQ